MKHMEKETRQENIFYLILWTLIFAAAPVRLLFRWLSGHSLTFGAKEMIAAWLAILPFLALFLIHNYLIAPLLIKKRRTALYLALLSVLLVAFGSLIFLTDRGFSRRGHSLPPPQKQVLVNVPERRPASERGPAPEMRPRPDGPGKRPGRPGGEPPMRPGTMKIIMGILLIGANLGAKFFFEARRGERRMELLKTEHLHNRLESLRYQINPHFFMNTLNNIHALVDIDPEKAKESIEEFSKLMRFVLYDGDRPTIPLARELEYLEHYISLMRIRYADSVRISAAFPAETADEQIPPLLLASFVENAFKHGVSYERESFIEVGVTLGDGMIRFSCENSRQGAEQQRKHGIGLANVRQRLDLLYGGNYTLEIQEKPTTYSICLQLPAAPPDHHEL